MEFKASNARVWYDADNSTVLFEGSFRLSTDEYGDVSKLLQDVLDTGVKTVKFDLTALEFLNSSGINVIAKFTIQVRNLGDVSLAIVGNDSIPWQSKSLPNLKKLFPALDLVIG